MIRTGERKYWYQIRQTLLNPRQGKKEIDAHKI
jgi:hypothetical protein